MGKKRIQTSNGWKKKSGNRTEDRAGYHLQYIVHSREEVWCLLFVEANCGCIVLKFQFFSVFSRFGMLHTFYHQEKKLYKEMQSFNIFPLDLFIENLIGFFYPVAVCLASMKTTPPSAFLNGSVILNTDKSVFGRKILTFHSDD